MVPDFGLLQAAVQRDDIKQENVSFIVWADLPADVDT